MPFSVTSFSHQFKIMHVLIIRIYQRSFCPFLAAGYLIYCNPHYFATILNFRVTIYKI